MSLHHVSVFHHDQKTYDCPDCKAPVERAHVHGWFWFCNACKKSFPLYALEPKGEAKVVDKIENKGLFGKLKEMMGGSNG